SRDFASAVATVHGNPSPRRYRTTTYEWRADCRSQWSRLLLISMLRIVRSIDAGTTTLSVSGRIDSEQVPQLRRSVEAERGQDIVLDLGEVGLVDVEAVRFLVQCETQGVRLSRCPAYVREWMARERCCAQ